MKRIFSIIFLLFLCFHTSLMAQRTMNTLNNQFGSSASGLNRDQYDRNGNPIDTTAVVDASTIPIGLYSWKVDSRFGNVTYIPVDTLQHAFQNSNDMGGYTGQYNYLGNLGSPRLSRIFFDRRDPSQYFFTDPYDFCVQRPEDVIFTNTLSPFTNLTYYKGGGSRDGEERFKSYFAINANKRLGFGFYIDYLYGRGLYQDQSTAFFNGGLFSSYRGDKYDMHFIFNNDNLKMAENGGITDDRYITNPLDMAEGKKEYSANEIPTRLSQIWNHNTSYHAFLTHRYNLGFYKEKQDSVDTDSVKITQVFVPVTSFIHTLQVDLNNRKYISYDDAQNQNCNRQDYQQRGQNHRKKILFADGVLVLFRRLFLLCRFILLLLVAHRAVDSLLEKHRLTPSPQACGGRRRSGSGEPLPTPERPVCRSPCSICSACGTCSPSAG